MREILFRGKRKAGDYWIHGDLRQWSEKRKGILDYSFGGTSEVYPETIGQFTGLFTMEEDEGGDTLCTFIYEGDIVEPVLIDGTHKGFSWGRQVVVFDRGAFCLKSRRGEITPMCNYAANVQFKVWGNIHDNPELLEVSE